MNNQGFRKTLNASKAMSKTVKQPWLLNICFVMPLEASSAIFKVFGITQPGIELTTSRTPGECSTIRPHGAVDKNDNVQ